MPNKDKPPPGLTIDRAAFLLLRVKKAFKKKKQGQKEKNEECVQPVRAVKGHPVRNTDHGDGHYKPPPLLRSQTLPAIIVPNVNVLKKQIDVNYATSSYPEHQDDDNQQPESSFTSNTYPSNVMIKNNTSPVPRIVSTNEVSGCNETSRALEDSCPNTVQNKSSNNSRSTPSRHNIPDGSQLIKKLIKLLNQRTDDYSNHKMSHGLLWERYDDNTTIFRLMNLTSLVLSMPKSTSIDSLNSLKNYNTIAADHKNATIKQLQRCNEKRESELDVQASNEDSKTYKMDGFGKRRNYFQQQNQENNHVLIRAINPLINQTSLNSQTQALFTAIENGRLDEVKIILETTDVNVNSLNSNGFSPLDIAMLNNNKTLVNMLLSYGAQEKTHCPLTALCVVNADVIGVNSVNIRFQINEKSEPICTKLKVQWSTKEDFSLMSGEKEISDIKQKEYCIDGLMQGQKYFFRVCLGNSKGYNRFISSVPSYLTPSSWRDIDGRPHRFDGRLKQLDSLFADIQRPEYTQDTPALQRRNYKKKTTIKQLFTTTSKFQKHLKRGIYLSCLLYHDDKILVTNEDFLPVIEIDEIYPSCIYNDFHWLMKIACTWDNVKTLRNNMEKSQGCSTNHFRLKLLQAIIQMQNALSIQDLGQIYYKPIKDSQGILVISTVHYIKSPKLMSLLNNRWISYSKLTKKVILQDDSNVAEILMANIPDQIAYHKSSNTGLTRGLYLGYLKMHSSVDLIQVVVPSKAPNVLPHCKIRDNPHVSVEEWSFLKKVTGSQTSVNFFDKDSNTDEKKNVTNEIETTQQAKSFMELLINAAHRLFFYMNISPENSQTHRLYDAEVIELSSEVSFLIIVPPVETVCLVPGAHEILLQRDDLLTLPIQVFEMVHLNAYQKDVVNCYSKLSCILELEIAQAQQNYREAFSSSEVITTKEKLTKLQNLQSDVNNIWKGARWLIDVITFARDRGSSHCVSLGAAGISMRNLLSIKQSSSHSLKRSLLQLPIRDSKVVKSSSGRGSWPGPNENDSASKIFQSSEFSKSEQQLVSENNVKESTNTFNSHRNILIDCKKNGNDFSSAPNLEPLQSSNREYVYKMSTKLRSDHLTSSSSEETYTSNQHKKSDSAPKNQLSVMKQSMMIPVNMCQSDINSGLCNDPFMNISTTSLTNTTSLLCIGNNSSDIIINPTTSEHYNTVSYLSTTAKTNSCNNFKVKLPNPTATIASISNTFLDNSDKSKNQSSSGNTPGILQVYAAYDTGLAVGTSLKLHVTPKTTAREVVDLVVKQLNMAVVLKGQNGPIYSSEEFSNFCLVAVIGARERCLRDDFKPLQLQNPWKKGRLYVRLKQDVLAALEHCSKHTAYL
ncbi:uncharacterized protein wake isoform X2 [Chelonus insularis]|uniref:uncharacterized protein wake isoform X2 n=1 Tax=Chelonus insularis TaxID=460826 RepID=UPI00158C7B03|nr:uncharacterized protein LOC118070238 isoform X2 [Chelonus insularis]